MKFPALPRAPSAVLAIGVVILGMAGLIDRVGILLSAVVFILGGAALPYAYAESPRAAVVPFVVGGLLVVVGGAAMALGASFSYSLITAIFGVLLLAYGAAAELPAGRAGAWDQPFPPRHPG